MNDIIATVTVTVRRGDGTFTEITESSRSGFINNDVPEMAASAGDKALQKVITALRVINPEEPS